MVFGFEEHFTYNLQYIKALVINNELYLFLVTATKQLEETIPTGFILFHAFGTLKASQYPSSSTAINTRNGCISNSMLQPATVLAYVHYTHAELSDQFRLRSQKRIKRFLNTSVYQFLGQLLNYLSRLAVYFSDMVCRSPAEWSRNIPLEEIANRILFSFKTAKLFPFIDLI